MSVFRTLLGQGSISMADIMAQVGSIQEAPLPGDPTKFRIVLPLHLCKGLIDTVFRGDYALIPAVQV